MNSENEWKLLILLQLLQYKIISQTINNSWTQNKGNQYLFSILKLEEDVQQDILKFV